MKHLKHSGTGNGLSQSGVRDTVDGFIRQDNDTQGGISTGMGDGCWREDRSTGHRHDC
jgi:hypothetical protein